MGDNRTNYTSKRTPMTKTEETNQKLLSLELGKEKFFACGQANMRRIIRELKAAHPGTDFRASNVDGGLLITKIS